MERVTVSKCDAEDGERNRYNLAFFELGLDWFWDADTYAALSASGKTTNHVQTYLETSRPHLLKAYDADFLINAIESVRSRHSPPTASRAAA